MGYLLGGRQLVCKLVPPDRVPRQLFRGWKFKRINKTPLRLKDHRNLVNDRPQIEVDGELLPQLTKDQVRRHKEKAEKVKAALETLSISYDIDGATNGGGQSDDEIIVPVSAEELQENISIPSSALLPESERPKKHWEQKVQKRKRGRRLAVNLVRAIQEAARAPLSLQEAQQGQVTLRRVVCIPYERCAGRTTTGVKWAASIRRQHRQ